MGLLSAEFGKALFLAGLLINGVIFFSGFIFASVATFIFLSIKRRLTNRKYGLFYIVKWSILIGLLGGIVAFPIARSWESYEARKRFVYYRNYDQQMQSFYPLHEVKFDRNAENITIVFSVPRDDDYTIYFDKYTSVNGKIELLPKNRVHRRINLSEGRNEISTQIVDELTETDHLDFSFTVKPSKTRSQTLFFTRNINRLFKLEEVKVKEGIYYYSPEIPYSSCPRSIIIDSCVEKDILQIQLMDK